MQSSAETNTFQKNEIEEWGSMHDVYITHKIPRTRDRRT